MVPIGRILIFASILLFSNGCQNAFEANNTWDPYITPPPNMLTGTYEVQSEECLDNKGDFVATPATPAFSKIKVLSKPILESKVKHWKLAPETVLSSFEVEINGEKIEGFGTIRPVALKKSLGGLFMSTFFNEDSNGPWLILGTLYLDIPSNTLHVRDWLLNEKSNCPEGQFSSAKLNKIK